MTEPEIRQRALRIRNASYDAASRSFTAVAATESPVALQDAQGEFDEILPMSAVRIGAGEALSVLDSHRRNEVGAVLGTATGWRVDGAELLADIVLSRAPDVDGIAARIEDGSLQFVSVGFAAVSYAEGFSNGRRTKTATAWRPVELSLVSVPADRNAQIRALHQESEMTQSTGAAPAAAPSAGAAAPAATVAAPAPGTVQDRAAIRTQIRSLCRDAGVTGEAADKIVDGHETVDSAKAAVLDARMESERAKPTIQTRGLYSGDDPTVIERQMVDGMAARMLRKRPKADDPAARFFPMSAMEIGERILESNGVQTRGLPGAKLASEILGFRAAGSHTTSDFTTIAGGAAQQVAGQVYQESRSRLTEIARPLTLPDYRETEIISLGGAGDLEEVGEDGEIVATSRDEVVQGIKLTNYARRIDFTLELLTNDRLGLFGDAAAEFGRAAVRRENKLLVAALRSVANLKDGSPPFHAGRGNISDGTDLTEAGLSTVRQAIRGREGPDGSAIDIDPRFLIVAPDRETAAEKLIAQIQPTESANVNVFAGRLELIVENGLPGAGSWYVAGAPGQLASLVTASLEGFEGPQIERQESFDRLGTSYRAWIASAAGWNSPLAIQRADP